MAPLGTAAGGGAAAREPGTGPFSPAAWAAFSLAGVLLPRARSRRPVHTGSDPLPSGARITGTQLRAALSLLGWTMGAFAQRTGISLGTVRRLCSSGARIECREPTARAVRSALEESGIGFLAAGHGVRGPAIDGGVRSANGPVPGPAEGAETQVRPRRDGLDLAFLTDDLRRHVEATARARGVEVETVVAEAVLLHYAAKTVMR